LDVVTHYLQLQNKANKMTYILSVEKVSKSFINKAIFKEISYNFENGCYCVVGPNGVGKTVLLEMLAGVELQNSGSIALSKIGASTSIKFKQRLAFIPGKPNFFPSTTGAEFLDFVMSTKKQSTSSPQLKNLLSKFKLIDQVNNKFSKMSLGTQKKVFLSTLVIGDNTLIILDEPTNGLDIESNEVLYELLNHLKKTAIIILATHDPILIERISPTIIELIESPTSRINISTTFKNYETETIL
jgi:ABC-2 type transport system ATP-binding protein